MGYLDELKEGEIIGVGSDGSLYNVSDDFFVILTCTLIVSQKYPAFAERVHEGLVDIFGEKGKSVALLLP